jgi:putative sigma-54 modulation protein
MKIIITGKNRNISDHLKKTIETKLSRLDKYFSNDVTANVTLSTEKDRQKVETTIKVAGAIFRAEEATTTDIYSAVDSVYDKLSSQMSKYKRKLIDRHKDSKEIVWEDIPDTEPDTEDNLEIVKRKKFELMPMSPEEAVLQMELLGHSFFVFLNMDTEGIGVAYKRNDGKYGLLETSL